MVDHIDKDPLQTDGSSASRQFSDAEVEAIFQEMVKDGAFGSEELRPEDVEPYRGEHIAIYQRRIVGHGPCPLALRAEVAARENIPIERPVILFIDDDKSLCL